MTWSTAVQLIFFLCMVATVGIGFFCATKLDSDHPLWVRLIVLSPSLTSLFTMAQIFRSNYIAFESDIARAVAMFLVYALIASRFTKNPWLDIRNEETS